MAKVDVLESIQDHCWNLAGNLQNEELTEENIVHIRQSYMTALLNFFSGRGLACLLDDFSLCCCHSFHIPSKKDQPENLVGQ